MATCLMMTGGVTLSDEPITKMLSPAAGLPSPAKFKLGHLRRDSSGRIVLEPESKDDRDTVSGDQVLNASEVPEQMRSSLSDLANPLAEEKVGTSANPDMEIRSSNKSIQRPYPIEGTSIMLPQPDIVDDSLETANGIALNRPRSLSRDAARSIKEIEIIAQGEGLPPPSKLKTGDLQRSQEGQLVLEPYVARDLRVCMPDAGREDCHYVDLSDALAEAKPGDTIIISPGIYEQAALVTVPGITIKGDPGAHLKGRTVEGKAALVIRADDVVVDGIECSEIRVRDRNGACVRIEGRNVTIRNSYFHDNQEGVLGGIGGYVTVEDSVFERNGFNHGFAHGLYISRKVELFSFRRNKVLSTKDEGQGVKSRAAKTVIEDSIIASMDSRDSRAIDIPNGGEVIIRRNVLQKGPNSANEQMIALGLEGNLHDSNSAVISNNIIIFDQNRPAWIDSLNSIIGISPPRGIVVNSNIDGRVSITDNIIVSAKEVAIGEEARVLENRVFANRSTAGVPEFPSLPSGVTDLIPE